MKFKLSSSRSDEKCNIYRRLKSGKYDCHALYFKDIKSVKTSLETNTYESLSGEHQEISHWYVEINTLEELMALEKEVNSSLVVDAAEIIIYDGYLE